MTDSLQQGDSSRPSSRDPGMHGARRATGTSGLLACAALVLFPLPGCDVERPSAAYNPDPRFEADMGGGPVMAPPVPDMPVAGIPGVGGAVPAQSAGGGAASESNEDGGVPEGSGTSVQAAQQAPGEFAGLEGKYLLKTEIKGFLDHSTLGAFESVVFTYSLLYVQAYQGTLYGREKQCHVEYQNNPEGGNRNSLRTTVSPYVPSYTPAVVRVFDIQENGSWRTLRAPVAVGWSHQYEAQALGADSYLPREPPSSAGDSLVTQWDDVQPGVTIRSEAVYIGASRTCETYVAQRVDPIYQGQLDAPLASGGVFDGGFVDGGSTVTNVLTVSSADCMDDGSSRSGARPVTENPLRLKRVVPGDTGYFEGTAAPAVEWTCPDKSLFAF